MCDVSFVVQLMSYSNMGVREKNGKCVCREKIIGQYVGAGNFGENGREYRKEQKNREHGKCRVILKFRTNRYAWREN